MLGGRNGRLAREELEEGWVREGRLVREGRDDEEGREEREGRVGRDGREELEGLVEEEREGRLVLAWLGLAWV